MHRFRPRQFLRISYLVAVLLGLGFWLWNPAVTLAQDWRPAGRLADSITAICCDYFPAQIILGTNNGLFISTDSGQSWTPTLPLDDQHVTALHSNAAGGIFIGTRAGLFGGTSIGAWNSTSIVTGVTAISSDLVIGTTDGQIHTINQNANDWNYRATLPGPIAGLASADGGRVIYAATSRGEMIATLDSGNNWKVLRPAPQQINGVGLYPDGTLLLSTADSGVYRSSDTGKHWIPFNQGLSDLHIRLMPERQINTKIVVATPSGVFYIDVPTAYTPNLDTCKWQRSEIVSSAPESVVALSFDSRRFLHAALGDGRVFTEWGAGSARHIANTKSPINFYASNTGVLFSSGAGTAEGLFWPRGDTASATIYGAGLWVGALKRRASGLGFDSLCEMGYDPNRGAGWFVPGEVGVAVDGANPLSKYAPYISSKFDSKSGQPLVKDDQTPTYRWPVWRLNKGAKSLQHNFYFGSNVSNVGERDDHAALHTEPVYVSDEDIINTYTDTPPSANPEYIPNQGYPIGLNIHEAVYTWGFGRYRDLIFVRYQATNVSSDTLFECYLAPTLDPDIWNRGANDAGGYIGQDDSLLVRSALGGDPDYIEFENTPAKLALGIEYGQSSTAVQSPAAGFALVESPISSNGRLIDDQDSLALGGYGPQSLYAKNALGLATLHSWTFQKDPSPSQRYAFVSSRTQDRVGTNKGDLRMMLATGPFTMLPHQTASTTLAIGIARPSRTSLAANIDSLIRLMASAHRFFAHGEMVGGDPNSVTIHHFNEAVPAAVHATGFASPGIELQCFPNPAANSLNIRFNLPVDASASLVIVDLAGRQVGSALSGTHFSRGEQVLVADVSRLASGHYAVRLSVGGITIERTIEVVR